MRKSNVFLTLSATALLTVAARPADAGMFAIHLEDMVSAAHAAENSIVEKTSGRRTRRSRGAGAAAIAPSAAAARRAIAKKEAKAAPSTTLLFGTQETQSDNFKPFKKWQGAMEKMANEQADVNAFKTRFKDWIAFLDTLKSQDKLTQIQEVNSFMNKSRYIQDNKNWGVSDYWASPGEFLAKFGDCEDYSIAKYMALKYLGHDPEDMRIVAVKDLNLKVGHAILVYYHEGRILVLDNQIKIVADSAKVRHYQPVYSINEKFWWRHRIG